jgi:glycerophosphoryl diester phosphodiesterase
VMIIGHRGGRNLWPENSLLGFRKLREMGVDGVEFDVHQTRDGGLVVIHDSTFDRTAEAGGPVAARTLSEVTAVRLRDAGDERVPTLEAVLDVYEQTNFELHVEIKTDVAGAAYPGLEAKLVELIRRRGLAERAILTCFVPEVLERVRAASPEARVLASVDRRSAEFFGGVEPMLERFLRINGILFAVEKSLLQLSQAKFIDELGTSRIAAWVPNEHDELGHWLSQPIRAVTTDRPDRALDLRASLSR